MSDILSTRFIEIERKSFSYGFELKDENCPYQTYATVSKVNSYVSLNYDLSVGDKIVSINDDSVQGKYYFSCRSIIRSSPNGVCKLEVISDQKPDVTCLPPEIIERKISPQLRPFNFMNRKSRSLIPIGSTREKIKLFQNQPILNQGNLLRGVSRSCGSIHHITPKTHIDKDKDQVWHTNLQHTFWQNNSASVSTTIFQSADNLENHQNPPNDSEDQDDDLNDDLDLDTDPNNILLESVQVLSQDPSTDDFVTLINTSNRNSNASHPTELDFDTTTIDLYSHPPPVSEPFDDYSLNVPSPNNVPVIDLHPVASYNDLANSFKSSLSFNCLSVSKSSNNLLEYSPEHLLHSSMTNLSIQGQKNISSNINKKLDYHLHKLTKKFTIKRQDSPVETIPVKLRIIRYYDKSKSKSWRDYVLERTDGGAQFRKRIESSKKDKYSIINVYRRQITKFEAITPSNSSSSQSAILPRKIHNFSHNQQPISSTTNIATHYNQRHIASASESALTTSIEALGSTSSSVVTNFTSTRYQLEANSSQIILRFYFNPTIFHDKSQLNQSFNRFKCIISTLDIAATACYSIMQADDTQHTNNNNMCPTTRICYLPECSICQMDGQPLLNSFSGYHRRKSSNTAATNIPSNLRQYASDEFNSQSESVFHSPQSNKENPFERSASKSSHLSLTESAEHINKDNQFISCTANTMELILELSSQQRNQKSPNIFSSRKISNSASVKSTSKSSFENISNSDISSVGLHLNNSGGLYNSSEVNSHLNASHNTNHNTAAPHSTPSKNILNKAIGLIKPDKKTTKTYEVFTGTKAEYEEFKRQLESGNMPMELKASDIIGIHSQKYIYEVPRIKSIPKIPMIIYLLTQIIERAGLAHEGIYRKTGNHRVVRSLFENLNKPLDEIDCDTEDWNNIHAICGTLKLFLRSLNERLIPADLSHFLAYSCKTVDYENSESLAKTLMDIRYHISSYQSIAHRRKLLNSLKSTQHLVEDQLDCHWLTLQYLLGHLGRVISVQSSNQMNEQATAICFAPVLMEPWQKSLDDVKADNDIMVRALELMITHRDWIFKDWDPASETQRSFQLMEEAHSYADHYINMTTTAASTTDADGTQDVRVFVRETIAQSTLDFSEPRKLERRHSSHTPNHNPMTTEPLATADLIDSIETTTSAINPLPDTNNPLPSDIKSVQLGITTPVDSPILRPSKLLRLVNLSNNASRSSRHTTDYLDLSIYADTMLHMTGIYKTPETIFSPKLKQKLQQPKQHEPLQFSSLSSARFGQNRPALFNNESSPIYIDHSNSIDQDADEYDDVMQESFSLQQPKIEDFDV